MTISSWRDPHNCGNRLAAHGLTGLLSFDLEGKARIGAIGAVHTDQSSTYTWKGDAGLRHQAVAKLDQFAGGAACLVGHNIIEHLMEYGVMDTLDYGKLI